MPTLAFSDPKTNLDAWAARLQISREAVEVYATSDVIDLHIDSFIWTRIFGYDLSKRHGGGVLGRHFYSHCDFPRAMEAGLTGGVWLITTNPFLPAKVRRDLFFRNLRRFEGEFEKHPDVFRIVRTTAQYREARAAGLHGVFLGVQGGNCLDYDLRDFDRLDPELGVILTDAGRVNGTSDAGVGDDDAALNLEAAVGNRIGAEQRLAAGRVPDHFPVGTLRRTGQQQHFRPAASALRLRGTSVR